MDAVSRYNITLDDIRNACLSLQIGAGAADRFDTDFVAQKIVAAEDWADQELSEKVFTPLRPTPAPGQTDFDKNDATTWTSRNYPPLFMQAVAYYTVGLLMHSEYSENSPNTSTYGEWAENFAYTRMERFKQLCSKKVGSNRRRHQNSFMPPTIAPPEQIQPYGGGGGG